MTETDPRWVPGYEDHYFATYEGKVFSCKSGEVREMKSSINARGYPTVCLLLNGVKSNCCVHIVVLKTFVGSKPVGMYGLHRDDDKMNNRVDNLYWGTLKQNVSDAVVNGTMSGGSHHPRSVLTPGQVLEIREKYKLSKWLHGNGKNVTHDSLAEEYEVNPSTIRNVVLGKTYCDV